MQVRLMCMCGQHYVEQFYQVVAMSFISSTMSCVCILLNLGDMKTCMDWRTKCRKEPGPWWQKMTILSMTAG